MAAFLKNMFFISPYCRHAKVCLRFLNKVYAQLTFRIVAVGVKNFICGACPLTHLTLKFYLATSGD